MLPTMIYLLSASQISLRVSLTGWVHINVNKCKVANVWWICIPNEAELQKCNETMTELTKFLLALLQHCRINVTDCHNSSILQVGINISLAVDSTYTGESQKQYLVDLYFCAPEEAHCIDGLQGLYWDVFLTLLLWQECKRLNVWFSKAMGSKHVIWNSNSIFLYDLFWITLITNKLLCASSIAVALLKQYVETAVPTNCHNCFKLVSLFVSERYSFVRKEIAPKTKLQKALQAPQSCTYKCSLSFSYSSQASKSIV